MVVGAALQGRGWERGWDLWVCHTAEPLNFSSTAHALTPAPSTCRAKDLPRKMKFRGRKQQTAAMCQTYATTSLPPALACSDVQHYDCPLFKIQREGCTY